MEEAGMNQHMPNGRVPHTRAASAAVAGQLRHASANRSPEPRGLKALARRAAQVIRELAVTDHHPFVTF